jgi:hypothetical protein
LASWAWAIWIRFILCLSFKKGSIPCIFTRRGEYPVHIPNLPDYHIDGTRFYLGRVAVLVLAATVGVVRGRPCMSTAFRKCRQAPAPRRPGCYLACTDGCLGMEKTSPLSGSSARESWHVQSTEEEVLTKSCHRRKGYVYVQIQGKIKVTALNSHWWWLPCMYGVPQISIRQYSALRLVLRFGPK